MDKIITLVDSLSGYKSYITGLLAVAYGIYTQNAELVFLGFATMGLRAAIK